MNRIPRIIVLLGLALLLFSAGVHVLQAPSTPLDPLASSFNAAANAAPSALLRDEALLGSPDVQGPGAVEDIPPGVADFRRNQRYGLAPPAHVDPGAYDPYRDPVVTVTLRAAISRQPVSERSIELYSGSRRIAASTTDTHGRVAFVLKGESARTLEWLDGVVEDSAINQATTWRVNYAIVAPYDDGSEPERYSFSHTYFDEAKERSLESLRSYIRLDDDFDRFGFLESEPLHREITIDYRLND